MHSLCITNVAVADVGPYGVLYVR